MNSKNATADPGAKKRPVFSIVGLVVIASLLLFLLSFHLVFEDGKFAIFPKQGLTFAGTVVDVDAVIDSANSRSLGERLAGKGVDNYLLAKLEEKGFIASEPTPSPFNHTGGSTTAAPSSTVTPTVTKAEYNQIRNGMSHSEVADIIGKAGEELSRSDLGGISTVMYQWVNDDGSNMNAMFQNGRLINKAQFGLP